METLCALDTPLPLGHSVLESSLIECKAHFDGQQLG
jgi:hypothetical protein